VVVLPNKPSKREISFETGTKRFYKIFWAKINIVNAPPPSPTSNPGIPEYQDLILCLRIPLLQTMKI
jgi:hypothetical protein